MKNKLTVFALLTLFAFSVNFAQTPANLASAVSINTNFAFTLTVPATANLQISTNSDFTVVADYVMNKNVGAGVTTYTFAAADLINSLSGHFAFDNSSIYYWRIYDTGAAANIEPAGVGTYYTFTTITAALPALYSPAHLANIVGNIIGFQWSMPSSGLKYKIEISSTSNFAALMAICPTGFFTTNSLSLPFVIGPTSATTIPAGTYYWRIKSYTSSDALISITNAWQFTIPGPPTPVAAYPINDQTVYTNSPQVYWYLNNYYYNSAVYYRVRYGIATGVYGATSATTTGQYVTLPGLTTGSSYFYVVDASPSSAFTTYNTSSEATFNVFYSSATLDAIPVFLTYPTGGSTVYSTNPKLYWFLGMQVPGITYDIDYAVYPGAFGAVEFTGVSGNEQALTGLTAGTTYQWRVRINGATTWYGPETFTVHSSATATSTSGPAIPTPSSPIAGTVVSTQSPTLTWTVFSTTPLDYQVIWSTSPILTAGVLTPTGTSGWLVTTSHTLSGLTPGATYYWQVRSRLSSTPATVSNYSSVGQFTVAAGASPVVVLPANPIVGSTINSTAANLSWIVPAQSSSTLTYDLEISKNKDLAGAQLISNLTQPSYKATNLEANKVYYWRVVSKTSGGIKSNYSYSGSFNSGSATAVKENEVPTQFELTQNYPNPFNPSTMISYSITKSSFVSLKVYDILGREVKTLVSQQMNAGKHNLNWNGDDNYGNKVSSGTYIYRITADNFVSSKKMILIK